MPSVVNGCGTWYYGKANKIGYEGFCEACGNLGLLVSYDTRLWVVFLMIPIVPLGRKRIIEECPACRKHRVMSLRLWEEARRRVATTAEDFRRSRHSADAATTAIHATVGVRDKVSFLEIAPEIEAAFRGNLTVLMTLASAHELFGNIAEQERLLRVAIEISNSDDISEALAQCLIRQNQPEEAHSYLQHVIDKRIPDRVNDLFQLAQAYQRGGDHERALEIYAACEAVNPLIKEDPGLEDESLYSIFVEVEVLLLEVLCFQL